MKTISEQELREFLHKTYKELGISRKLCKVCDSPASINHQGIWCENCHGEMTDRSGWTILACTERLENSLKRYKRLEKWALLNLVNTVGCYLVDGEARIPLDGVKWAWDKENRDWVIDVYRKELERK